VVRCNVYMYIWYPVTEMSIQLVDYWDTDIQPQPENFTSPPTCSSFQHCLPLFNFFFSRPFFLFLKFIFVFLNHSHCPGHFLITPFVFFLQNHTCQCMGPGFAVSPKRFELHPEWLYSLRLWLVLLRFTGGHGRRRIFTNLLWQKPYRIS